MDDLSGREVFTRTGSTFYASLVALNGRLKAKGKPPVDIREVPGNLEDDDLLEMVNAGLIPTVVLHDRILEKIGGGGMGVIRAEIGRPATAPSAKNCVVNRPAGCGALLLLVQVVVLRILRALERRVERHALLGDLVHPHARRKLGRARVRPAAVLRLGGGVGLA
jgi:hypothetical protein